MKITYLKNNLKNTKTTQKNVTFIKRNITIKSDIFSKDDKEIMEIINTEYEKLVNAQEVEYSLQTLERAEEYFALKLLLIKHYTAQENKYEVYKIEENNKLAISLGLTINEKKKENQFCNHDLIFTYKKLGETFRVWLRKYFEMGKESHLVKLIDIEVTPNEVNSYFKKTKKFELNECRIDLTLVFYPSEKPNYEHYIKNLPIIIEVMWKEAVKLFGEAGKTLGEKYKEQSLLDLADSGFSGVVIKNDLNAKKHIYLENILKLINMGNDGEPVIGQNEEKTLLNTFFFMQSSKGEKIK